MQLKKHLKNKFILIPAAGLLAFALVAAIGAAAIAAASSYGPGIAHAAADGSNFPARVAQKLNAALGLAGDDRITDTQMQTAFNAATSDLQEERLQQKLTDAGVAQEDADAIMTWFRAWPYSELVQLRAIGFARNADQVERKLARLVEKERITQAQSDGILSWFNDRPELPEELERAGHGRHHRKGDGDRGTARHHRGGDGDPSNGNGQTRFHQRGGRYAG